jgi:hypothetical protein
MVVVVVRDKEWVRWRVKRSNNEFASGKENVGKPCSH